ncbi:MAG: LAGLIDADG family homing endonuclease, partial [Acidimicrobiales bacterium]
MASQALDLGRYKLGWSDAEDYVFKPKRGLNEDIVNEMSWMKGEPDWMRNFRLKALRHFERRPLPTWGGDMSEIFFNDIYYYFKPTDRQVDTWEALPDSVKATYEKLGIPEAERKYLAGVTAQYECLRGSTLVWTTEGLRPIKEIGPGDVVFSLDEETKQVVTAKVVAQACSGEKEVFELSARGRRIGASANHPFLVLRDERRPGRQRARYKTSWVAVEDLRVGDLVAIPTDLPEYGESATLIPVLDSVGRFPRQSSVDFCWWAGLYLGDGFVHHRGAHPSVEIAIDLRDETLVEEIRRVTLDLFGIEMRVAADGARLVGTGTRVLAEFLEMNGFGGGALGKRVPEWMFALPSEERLAFLAGYVDADGYVRSSESARNVVLTSANECLLEDFREMAQLSGIGAGAVRPFT